MKPTTRKTTAKKTTTAKAIQLPPQALAVALLSAPENILPVTDAMTETWRAIPAILQTIAEGQVESTTRATIWHLMEGVTPSGWTEQDCLRQLRERLDLEGDEDGIMNIEGTFSRIGFEIGLMFACYVLTQPVPAVRP